MPPPGGGAGPRPNKAGAGGGGGGVADAPLGAADDYEWVAPSGQSGDGKTALNKKLGY